MDSKDIKQTNDFKLPNACERAARVDQVRSEHEAEELRLYQVDIFRRFHTWANSTNFHHMDSIVFAQKFRPAIDHLVAYARSFGYLCNISSHILDICDRDY